MRARYTAIAGLMALWSSHAGAASPKIIYSFSGIVGDCKYCYQTQISFDNIPTISGPLLLQLNAPGLPDVDNSFLYYNYSGHIYYFNVTPNGSFPDYLADEILGSDGPEYQGFATEIITGSSNLIEEYDPINYEQISYGLFLQPFTSDEFEQVYSVGTDSAGFSEVLDASALGKPFSLTISTVPEISTWGFMLFGLGLVGAGFRRRSRSDISPRPRRN